MPMDFFASKVEDKADEFSSKAANADDTESTVYYGHVAIKVVLLGILQVLAEIRDELKKRR